MKTFLASILLATAALAGIARADVPTSIPFAGRLAENDVPIEGSRTFIFQLYDAQTGGTAVWSETHTSLGVEKGLVYARLGSQSGTELDADILDGRRLYLQITMGDQVFMPRLPIESVPYAVHATTADNLAGLTPDDLQVRVDGACPPGQMIRAINADGTVSCDADDSNDGTLTGVTTGPSSGLTGGGLLGTINLAVNTAFVQRRIGAACAPGQAIRAIAEDGTVTCEVDDDSPGITGVTTGPSSGLTGGGLLGTLNLAVNTAFVQRRIGAVCPAGQSIRAIAEDGGVTCEIDDDTSNPGTITGVTAGTGLTGGGSAGTVGLAINTAVIQARVAAACPAESSIRAINADGTVACETDSDTATSYAAGPGIAVASNTIALSTSGCVAGDVWKWNGAGWSCDPNLDTTGSGTISGVTAGTGLTGGGSAGTVGLAVNFAVAQARVAASCPTDQAIRAINADGTVACEPDSDTIAAPYTAGAGIAIAASSIALSTSGCVAGDVWKWNGAGWSCDPDLDTTGGGTISGVTAGTGLTGGGSAGSVSLAVNPAAVQTRVTGSCAAGQAVRAIAQDGSVTCEPKAARTFLGAMQIPVAYNGTAATWTMASLNGFDISNALAARGEFLKTGQVINTRMCVVYTDNGPSNTAQIHFRIKRDVDPLLVHYTLNVPATWSGNGLHREMCGAWVNPAGALALCDTGWQNACKLEVQHDLTTAPLILRSASLEFSVVN